MSLFDDLTPARPTDTRPPPPLPPDEQAARPAAVGNLFENLGAAPPTPNAETPAAAGVSLFDDLAPAAPAHLGATGTWEAAGATGTWMPERSLGEALITDPGKKLSGTVLQMAGGLTDILAPDPAPGERNFQDRLARRFLDTLVGGTAAGMSLGEFFTGEPPTPGSPAAKMAGLIATYEGRRAEGRKVEDALRAVSGRPTLAEQRAANPINRLADELTGFGRYLGGEAVSEAQQAQDQALAEATREGFTDTLKYAATNPLDLVGSVGPSTAAYLLPAAAVGRTAGAVGRAGGLSEQAAAKLAGTAGITAVGGTATVQNAADVAASILEASPEDLSQRSPLYRELVEKGLSPDQAQAEMADRAFSRTLTASGLSNALTLGIAARFRANVVEDWLAGRLPSVGRGAAAGLATGATKETLIEAAQEGGEAAATGIGEVGGGIRKPEEMFAGVPGAAAVGGIAGGIAGAAVGGATGARTARTGPAAPSLDTPVSATARLSEGPAAPAVDTRTTTAPAPAALGAAREGREPPRTDTRTRRYMASLPPEELAAINTLPPAQRDSVIRRMERLAEQAETDTMTGLKNRNAWEARVPAPRMALIDVDGLKWVNDNLGHESGDKLLKAIAGEIAGITDQAYRIGGDEFALEGASEAEVQTLLARLDERLAGHDIDFETLDGRILTYRGLQVSHGTGVNQDEADTQIKASREERAARGEYQRGQRPGGFRETAAERQPDQDDQAPAQESRLSPQLKTKLADLYEEARTGAPQQKRAVRYSPVPATQAQELERLAGQSFQDFRHSVDNYAIRHVLKEHGDPRREAAKNQEAVTLRDFQYLPEIVSAPDTIQYLGQSKQGLPLFRYTKRRNGVTYVIEETRNKRKELALKTLWKTRAAPDDAGPAPPARTPEAFGRSPHRDVDSVVDRPEDDNPRQSPRGQRTAADIQRDSEDITAVLMDGGQPVLAAAPRTEPLAFTPPEQPDASSKDQPPQPPSDSLQVLLGQFPNGYDPSGEVMPAMLKDSLLGWRHTFESASDKLRRMGGSPMARVAGGRTLQQIKATAEVADALPTGGPIRKRALETLHSAMEPVGELVDRVFDREQRNIGAFNQIMAEPARQATQEDREQFQLWARHWDQNETGSAQTLYDNMSEAGQALVDAWKQAADMTGRRNQEVGVQVFDPKLGKMRPIGKVAQYWPRRLVDWAQHGLYSPTRYPKDWARVVETLIDQGVVHSEAEARQFVKTNTVPGLWVSHDYFAAIERARTKGLPPVFYDHSLETGLEYGRRWAERLAQIETFGQDGGMFGDVLDRVIRAVQDPRLKHYLRRVKSRVYNETPIDPIGRLVSGLNMAATGLQLGNIRTAAQNWISGMGLNYVALGKYALGRRGEAQWKAMRLEAGAIKESEARGVLRDDVLNVQRDLAENTYTALSAFTRRAMKFGGFDITEREVRLQSDLGAKYLVRDAILQIGKNPFSGRSKQLIAFLQRNGFDYEKLLAENGQGEYTDRVLRFIVNMSQGSYRINMTPVLADEPYGRLLLKYRKYGTQVSRLKWRNHLEPFIKSISGGEVIQIRDPVSGQLVDKRAYDFVAMLRLLALPPIYGYANKWVRWTAFGSLAALAGPDWDDISEQLKDQDTAKAVALALQLVWESIIMSGILGNFQTPVQVGRDVSEMKSLVNPLDPPAYGPIKSTWDLFSTWYDQGKLTPGDIDFWLNRTLSFYNAYIGPAKRLAAEMTGWDAGKLELYRRQRHAARKEVRRYAKAMNLEAERKSSGGGFRPTAQTPVNRSISDALIVGRPEQARVILRQYLNTLTSEAEIRAALTSAKAHVRNQQPIVIGSQYRDADRRNFLVWAQANLSEEKYQRILALDDRYRRAAQQAGFLKLDTPAEEFKAKVRYEFENRPLHESRRNYLYNKLGVGN